MYQFCQDFKSLEATFRATPLSYYKQVWQIQYVNNRALIPLFLRLSAGTSNCALNHSCIWCSSPWDSHSRAQANQTNKSSLPKALKDPPAQHRAAHRSFKQAAAPQPDLMIHISWIKDRQQRHQQVSWTVCIRKTLYLRKLQHISCSQSVGSSSVCRVVREGCWQPNWGPTMWIERWFCAIIGNGL